ncbi:peptidyl-prolyl cis-trans isomerase, partial [Acinetobacter baumannii]
TGMKVGEVYPELIKTEYGYHIVKLAEKKPAGITPLSEVKEAIKAKLLQKKQTEVIFNWLKDQHKTADIKLSPEFQKIVATQPDTEVKLQ